VCNIKLINNIGKMGCGVNGCLKNCGANAGQPANARHAAALRPDARNGEGQDSENTIVDGVCLKEANAGHYFTENELFGENVSRSTIKQLQYRHEKWKIMCTFKAADSRI